MSQKDKGEPLWPIRLLSLDALVSCGAMLR